MTENNHIEHALALRALNEKTRDQLSNARKKADEELIKDAPVLSRYLDVVLFLLDIDGSKEGCPFYSISEEKLTELKTVTDIANFAQTFGESLQPPENYDFTEDEWIKASQRIRELAPVNQIERASLKGSHIKMQTFDYILSALEKIEAASSK